MPRYLCLMLLGLCLLVMQSAHAADAIGTVNDVVTDKVVAITAPEIELVPGQTYRVEREGTLVGRIEVRTASGICTVLEGELRAGDSVVSIPAEAGDAADAADATTESDTPQVPETALATGPLRDLLVARGELELGLQGIHQLGDAVPEALRQAGERATALAPKLFLAAWLLQLDSLEARVAASLHQQGKPALADQILPEEEAIGLDDEVADALSGSPILAPIWPDAVPDELLPNRYGVTDLIDPNPRLWGAPIRWDRPPANPAFAGWTLDTDHAGFTAQAAPLIRTDFALDDMRVSGRFRLSDGEFAYVLLRSSVLVKFYSSNAEMYAGKVSAKFGYDNIRVVDALSSEAPIENDRWYTFTATLRGHELTVELDGERVVAGNLTSGIMGRTGELPTRGYVGIGNYRASGTFRDLEVEALSAPGRDAMPRFRQAQHYRTIGEPIDLLSQGKEHFISLAHHRAERYKASVHPVEEQVLTLRSAPFSQFSVQGIEGEHWRARGRIRPLRRGSIWFRVNRYLLFGLDVQREGSADANAFPFMVSHTTSSFRDPDETFPGQPLEVGTWYDWELEYHEPVGVFRLNGETVMMSVTPENRRASDDRGPNQLGFSVYVAQAELREIAVQKLAAEPAGITLDRELIAGLLRQGLERIDRLVTELAGSEHPGYVQAANLLTGDRQPLLATETDYRALAESFRDAHDWPTYLAMLEANAQRLPAESEARQAAMGDYELARQKYEIANETATVGDIGLDGILRIGDSTGPVAQAADRHHAWISIPGNKSLALYDPQSRRVVRTIPAPRKPQALVARAEYLILLAEDARTLFKIATSDGAVLGQVRAEGGPILDLAAAPRRAWSWLAVNQNTDDAHDVAKYKIYGFDEAGLELHATEAMGMFIAPDPLGRYLYTGFSVEISPTLQLDPGPLMLIPVRGSIDHLLAYRVTGDTLAYQGDRPAPGAYGAGIRCEPRGRLVTWLAEGGYWDMMEPEKSGPALPAFQANDIRRLRDLYSSGNGVTTATYHPTLPLFYAYTGSLVRIFHATSFTARGSIQLPPSIPRNGVTDLQVTADGRELLITYQGEAAGVYLHRLAPSTAEETAPDALPTELVLLPPEQLIERADALRANGETELADRLLTWCANEYAFTAAGNEAARRLLADSEQRIVPADTELLRLAEAELQAPPALPAYDELQLPEGPAHASPPADTEPEAEEAQAAATAWQDAFATLRSFSELGSQHPDSWLYLADTLAVDHYDDPQLLLLAGDIFAAAGRLGSASQLAQRVLDEAPAHHHGRAYALLATIYGAAEQPAQVLAALQLAVRHEPRNAFLHRRFADAVDAAGSPRLARYHWLLSYYIYPSQHDLRGRLRELGLLPPTPDTQPAIADLFQLISPSVILIKQQMGVGTGFFISRDGLLLSNHHVIGDREEVEVVFSDADGQEQHTVIARVIGSTAQGDMAILRLDPGDRDIQPLVIGGDHTPSTGDRVIVIGNPGMGNQVLAQTLTEGIISNLRREIGGQRYLQTSAAVNPGNSGGPLLASDGTVIGMITLKAQLDNVGFAIPADILLDFAQSQIAY